MLVGTLGTMLTALAKLSSATYAVALVGEDPDAYIAVDKDGRPAILVQTSSTTSREVARRGLRLRHKATCHVEIGGTSRTVAASLVACESDDPALQAAFVSVAEIILSRLSTATEAEVAQILEELIDLLERAGEPSREGAIGLFAELLVLSLARDPCHAVRSWRVGAGDRHDVVAGTGRIEVKASGSRERRHSFSMEQCLPDPGTKIFVASTLVLEAAGGTGVRDLADRLRLAVRTEPQLEMKVAQAVLSVMGLPREGEPQFDEIYATTKLRWYDVESLPAVRIAPAAVDQVRFRMDLTGTVAVAVDDIGRLEPALAPCLP